MQSQYESVTPRCFTDEELAEALRYYRKCREEGFTPIYTDFKAVFHCSSRKAEMLCGAVSWAYRVQEKEKAEFEAKRKKAC